MSCTQWIISDDAADNAVENGQEVGDTHCEGVRWRFFLVVMIGESESRDERVLKSEKI